MAELETLRSSLSRMEGELDERRTRLDVSATDESTERAGGRKSGQARRRP